MRTRNRGISLHKIAATVLLLGVVVRADGSTAQESPELDAVKAANQAFYTALSTRDIVAMQKAWSSAPDVQYIAPFRKGITVGWEGIKTGLVDSFARRLPSFKVVLQDTRYKIDGNVAWVSGTEHASLENKAGQIIDSTNLATNIFEKGADGWRMVYHHASLIADRPEPQ